MRLRQCPAVERGAIGNRGCSERFGGEVRFACVQGLERHRVPVRQQRLAHNFFDGGVTNATCLPRRTAGKHEPAHRVGAVLIHQRNRLEHIAKMLRHLATLLVKDVAEADDVLVRGSIEYECADGHQRVEPAAGLIDCLADEVRWVHRLEVDIRAMRITELRKRHRTRVEPAVDHFRNAGCGLTAVRTRERDVIDVRAMRINARHIPAALVRQFRQRTDCREMVVGATPDRQRCAPVALARQRPVDVVVQPVAVAAPLDRFRVPVRAFVLSQQRILDCGGADVPRRLRVVEQCGVATPAVRIRVLVGQVAEQHTVVLEQTHKLLIGGLEELATDFRHRCLEMTVSSNRIHHRQSVLAAGLQVLGTECR